MTAPCPKIHAVMEVAIRKEDVWFELPPEPWPSFIRLCRSTTEEEIALLVGTLSSYGRDDHTAAPSAEDLAKHFPSVLPGGFAVTDGERTILPGCCCGLETWKDWLEVLARRGSPWTGHDPAPLIEVNDGHVYAWSDGAVGGKPSGETPLVFTSEQFDKAVHRAAEDLQAVLVPLNEWLQMHAPRNARAIAEGFRKTFVDCSV